jgi:hypothetical protein
MLTDAPEGLGELGYLEDLPPGPQLASALGRIDRSRLSGYDMVTLLKAQARQIAHDQAELYATMITVADATAAAWGLPDRTSQAWEFQADEIRAALALTRYAAEHQLALARDLIERLPQVWDALHAGRIDLPNARAIVAGTARVSQAVAWQIADEVLARAPERTTGQLRARIQKLVIASDPDGARERYGRTVADRAVIAVRDDATGTGSLHATALPADRANAAMRRINRLSRKARRRGDPRTMDQVRADVFLDLLCGRQHPDTAGGSGAVVVIRVDLASLAGMSDAPAEIPGWGPVIADLARRAVAEQHGAEWRIVLTDPATGGVVHETTTRRRPTAAQRRRVEARHPTCTFPGCRMPAVDCDIAHLDPFGEHRVTRTGELHPACRHDHRGRHVGGWRVHRHRVGGHLWTSPLGRRYLVRPEPP